LENGECLSNPLETEHVVPKFPLEHGQWGVSNLLAATSILSTGRSVTPFTMTGFSEVYGRQVRISFFFRNREIYVFVKLKSEFKT
jgi:hypothetical protein